MSVRYGFTIEVYGFMHTLRTFLARAAHDAMTGHIEVEDLRIEVNARTSPEIWKTVNYSTKR